MECESVIIRIAVRADVKYIYQILEAMKSSAHQRGAGISHRPVQYLCRKIYEGKAVVAVTDGGQWVGFSYLEAWSQNAFVSNGGLIVDPGHRGKGVASLIKKMIFDLSRKLYPAADIFTITTGAAVLKMNSDLGFRPVTFSQVTSDNGFWNQCNACVNYSILESKNRRMCLCTAMIYYSDCKQA
jgi:GNAT superfamily N-acetyltransferase